MTRPVPVYIFPKDGRPHTRAAANLTALQILAVRDLAAAGWISQKIAEALGQPDGLDLVRHIRKHKGWRMVRHERVR